MNELYQKLINDLENHYQKLKSNASTYAELKKNIQKEYSDILWDAKSKDKDEYILKFFREWMLTRVSVDIESLILEIKQ